MINDKAEFVLFHLLRFQDHLGMIEPGDILKMWRDLKADDSRILYHLRNALPGGAPVPEAPGLSFTVEVLSKGWPAPVALEVTFQGQRQHLDETALVTAARRLMSMGDAGPSTSKPPPERRAVQMSLF